MRRYFFLVLLWTLSLYAADPRSTVLYNSCKGPSSALLGVLSAYGIEHEGSWESIVDATQKQWMQKGKERWDYQGQNDLDPSKSYCLFSTLHMTSTLCAEKTDYEYAVLLGGNLKSVRDRFLFLKSEWERGIRFNRLVLLTGDRPLEPSQESPNQLLHSPYPARRGWKAPEQMPTNEAEMVAFVFEQLDLPDEWRYLPVDLISTPAPAGQKRPNTYDTFVYWTKEKHPEANSVIIISSQPFVGRQDTVARWVLPSCFDIETIGKGFSLEEYQRIPYGLTILQDELAVWIFSSLNPENKYRGG